MLIANFDKSEELLYRKAVKIFGCNSLYVDKNAYWRNGEKADSMSALRSNDCIDLTEFWGIHENLRSNMIKAVEKSQIRVFGENSRSSVIQFLFTWAIQRDSDGLILASSKSFEKYKGDVIRTMYTGLEYASGDYILEADTGVS